MDGKENGPFEIYHENGRLKRKGYFKEGRLSGEFESYDQEGRLVNKTTYKNGQEIG
jgi:antitoxin component YwqK of YwqJK toxin-antitoxin module